MSCYILSFRYFAVSQICGSSALITETPSEHRSQETT